MSEVTILQQDPEVFGITHFDNNVAQSSVDVALISAPGAGKKLKVVSLLVVAAQTPSDVTFESGGSSIRLGGLLDLGAGGGFSLPFNPVGWIVCAENASLTVTTGAGGATAISGAYVVVPA